MPFPRHLLTDDEDLVLDLRPHWWFLAPAGALLAVAVLLGLGALANDSWWSEVRSLLGLFVLGSLAWFCIRYLTWTTTNFVVTNERVISRTGVISKKGIEIPLDRINTVFFNQSLFERAIGAGDIGIESAGEGGRQTFTDIRKPSLVQNEIYRQVETLEARKMQRLGEAAAGGAPRSEPVASIPEQIEKLDQLRRQGVLTEEEFARKKRELLDRM
ncbi:MAG TPA: PH domain-containing protein [Acidimicrobiia bacterium]|nr:PH domain-containing protein [Acidimicrobiia bacterium]